jgi:hypothetical protein
MKGGFYSNRIRKKEIQAQNYPVTIAIFPVKSSKESRKEVSDMDSYDVDAVLKFLVLKFRRPNYCMRFCGTANFAFVGP